MSGSEEGLEESSTGVGVDRGSITAIRAHSVNEWSDVLAVTPYGSHWILGMGGTTIQLDGQRMRLLGEALIEAAS